MQDDSIHVPSTHALPQPMQTPTLSASAWKVLPSTHAVQAALAVLEAHAISQVCLRHLWQPSRSGGGLCTYAVQALKPWPAGQTRSFAQVVH